MKKQHIIILDRRVESNIIFNLKPMGEVAHWFFYYMLKRKSRIIRVITDNIIYKLRNEEKMYQLGKKLLLWTNIILGLIVSFCLLYLISLLFLSFSPILFYTVNLVLILLLICLIGIAMSYIYIDKKLKNKSRVLIKEIGLNVSSILNDRDYYEFQQKSPSFLKTLLQLKTKKKREILLEWVDDGEKDMRNIVNWLKENPHIDLLTSTHDGMKKLLEKQGLIKLDYISEDKRLGYIKWKCLVFKTRGKVNVPRPKKWRKYKIIVIDES